MKQHDHEYMERCLELAERGYGRVHPNPMVGALIVHRGKIVSEGHHRRFGGPHAEVECLKKAGKRAKGGTLYVSLEPCIHHGKTPPCVDSIIESGIREVVVAMRDPDRRVSGRGIRSLRKAGIEVRMGLLRKDAETLNKKFMWWHTTGRPFVGLKWAQTLDGFVADTFGKSHWITGPDARRFVHSLRSGYDGILVGAGTVLADNPQLTVRHVAGRDPVRIVVDGKLRVSGNERVFRHKGGRTIVLTSTTSLRRDSSALRRLLSRNVEVLGVGQNEEISPQHLLKALAGVGVTSVLVEGGPRTIKAFLDARCYNVYHTFIRPSLLRGGVSAAPPRAVTHLRDLGGMEGSDITLFRGGDILLEGKKK